QSPMQPTPPDCNSRPDSFNQTEGRCALQKSVYRSQRACDRKGQDVPVASRFERVRHQHQAHRKKSKRGQQSHTVRVLSSSECLSRHHLQVLEDGTEAQRGKESQSTHNRYHSNQEQREKRRGHGKGSKRWWHVFLLRQIA